MKLYVKNMASNCRRLALKSELDKLGIKGYRIVLGEVDVHDTMSLNQLVKIKRSLSRAGFDLMDDHKAILVERVKVAIVEMVRFNDEIPKTKISNYLSEKLNHDYTYVANLFSDITGNTIESFCIHQKIERVKELLLFSELNLTQISYMLNYSSLAHLSSQFKSITGLTPSIYRQLRSKAVAE